jgi:ech hydrogenase subunit E
MHGMGYCMGVEQVMGIKVPEKGEFLRTFWAELSRVHSHLLWLGLTSDAIGFENLFMSSWKLREYVLEVFEMTTGGRVIFSVCKIGGVHRDIDEERMKRALENLDKVESGLKEISHMFFKDKSIIHRLGNIGVLSKEQAFALGVLGPVARASGLVTDIRTTGYSAYPYLDLNIQTHEGGDCLARAQVRVNEIYESIRLIRQIAEIMPKDGPIDTPVKGNPDGEAFVRLEQPRGEVIYYVKGNGTKFLDRMSARTPTTANIPAILEMMVGVELSDVPVIITTIDTCISCNER